MDTTQSPQTYFVFFVKQTGSPKHPTFFTFTSAKKHIEEVLKKDPGARFTCGMRLVGYPEYTLPEESSLHITVGFVYNETNKHFWKCLEMFFKLQDLKLNLNGKFLHKTKFGPLPVLIWRFDSLETRLVFQAISELGIQEGPTKQRNHHLSAKIFDDMEPEVQRFLRDMEALLDHAEESVIQKNVADSLVYSQEELVKILPEVQAFLQKAWALL